MVERGVHRDKNHARRLSVLSVGTSDTRGRETKIRADKFTNTTRHGERDIRIDGSPLGEQIGIDTQHVLLDLGGVGNDSPAHNCRRTRDARERSHNQTTGQRFGDSNLQSRRGQSRNQFSNAVAAGCG